MTDKSFIDIAERLDRAAMSDALHRATESDVLAALARRSPSESDAVALFSPAAEPVLEEMVRTSAAITERRFGRTIQLYAPLYLSNECTNICRYCGFSALLPTPRVSLDREETRREAEPLRQAGFQHVLLVTGEARARYGPDRLDEAIRDIKSLFASVSIEVFPMNTKEYARMERAGADALTLYQETYDPELYRDLHPRGPKSSFGNRLRAIESGGEAGFRSLGVGALLGLADWRMEAVNLFKHARFLADKFWRSRIAVSFPRLNPAEGGFVSPHPMSDTHLVQMIAGMRILLPDAELVLSTREPAHLRDNLVGLGVTRMSAGSRTNPGGYTHARESGRQFSVADERGPQEVAAMIAGRGYEPVWKDFDPQLRREGEGT